MDEATGLEDVAKVLAADFVVGLAMEIAHRFGLDVDRIDGDGRLRVCGLVRGAERIGQVVRVHFDEHRAPGLGLFVDVLYERDPGVEFVDVHAVHLVEVLVCVLEEGPLIDLEVDRQ